MPTIKHECDACSGTGLYRGFCEGDGQAVVCVRCEGRGWVNYTYKLFAGRKKRRGVREIRYSRGSSIATGFGGQGEPMSYAQFEQRIPDA